MIRTSISILANFYGSVASQNHFHVKMSLCHLIPPGQCGSRKAHESMALVILKRNNWDLLRLQRRAAGWISNDAKSCFDRIVHWVGMVALYWFGIPWPALLMMFGTLQLATHRVRTGFGDSEVPFFPPSKIPFQVIEYNK